MNRIHSIRSRVPHFWPMLPEVGIFHCHHGEFSTAPQCSPSTEIFESSYSYWDVEDLKRDC